MKRKFFLSLVSVLLGGICLTASACSCASLPPLSFTSDWNDNKNNIGYKETAIYTVTHDDDFNSDGLHYIVSDAVKEKVDFSFTGGEYKVTAEVVLATALPSKYTGNIEVETGKIIHLTTEFKITSQYKYGSLTEPETYNDYIVTDSYICTNGASYTPLYVVQENKYAILSMNDKGTEVTESHFKREYIYSTNEYTINEIDVNDNTVKASLKCNYTYRTAIDNSELIFALRNVNIEAVKGTYSLPTITATYRNPQALKISRLEDATENLNFKVNNVDYSKVQVRKYAFNVDNQMMAGKSQLVFIQTKSTEQTDAIDYRAHIVKYVAPLSVYGSFAPMGAMVYTLDSVEYTK